MSSRSARSNQAPPPASSRSNEYFVPRDGIDREVITADVCRYLGNDALVRPGVYENPQTGQVVQGYYITAYRNLTTAMIEDLKADSARWEQERRSQNARNPVGVQYRNSDIHQSRQYYGPSETGNIPESSPYDATPRYPGTGSAGYTGAATGYTPQSYGNQGGYGGQNYTPQAQQSFSPAPAGVAYQGDTPMSGTSGFGQAGAERPYTQVNANRPLRGAETPMYGASDPYGSASRDSRVPVTTMSQGMPTYVTAGPPSQGYPASGSGPAYYSPNQSSAPSQYASQPVDVFYGRASPAGNPSYGSAHDPQYGTAPVPRTSAPPSNTQMATSGPSARRSERDSVDRHTDSSRHRSRR